MILHIVDRSDWDRALRAGRYEPATLQVEGFIHCSTPAQVIETANRFFVGRSDSVLICIDEERVRAQLRYEAPDFDHGESNGERFPHIYGSLNPEAVTKVVKFPCEPDGSFRMPAVLERQLCQSADEDRPLSVSHGRELHKRAPANADRFGGNEDPDHKS